MDYFINQNYQPSNPERRLPQPINGLESLRETIQLHNLYLPNGNFDNNSFSRLKEEVGNRRSAVFILHPFAYREASLPCSDSRYYGLFSSYIDGLKQLFLQVKKRTLPVIIAQQVEGNPLEYKEESVEAAKQELRENLSDYCQVSSGNYWVVMTEDGAPYPLIPPELLLSITENSRGFIQKHGLSDILKEKEDYQIEVYINGRVYLNWGCLRALNLSALVRQFRDANISRVLFAGSYLGGNVKTDKKDCIETERKKVQVVETGQKIEIQRTSNIYYPASTDGPRNSRHPLSIISPQGCIPVLMSALEKQGITVALSKYTFPERLPKSADLIELKDNSGNSYWMDSGSPLSQQL